MFDFDYTLRTVMLGTALLGATCGGLGAFAVLRGQSLTGDAVAHAALPGVALAFMAFATRDPLVLAAGAALTGWLAVRAVGAATSSGETRTDSALAVSLASFFGLGLVLLTFVQRRPDAQQAGLDRYLFGQAASLITADVWRIGLYGLSAAAAVALTWRPLALLTFDRAFGEALGFRMGRYDRLLMLLLVGAVVIGLEAVGVVLVSALVVAPGVAARQWTDRLAPLVLLAALFGAVAGATGAFVSALDAKLPTGPLVVLVACGLAAVSMGVGRWRERRAAQVRAPGRRAVPGLEVRP